MAAGAMVFRRSARLFVLRLSMLMLVTFGGLAVLMHPDWRAALGITGLATAVASLWYYLARHRAVSVIVDDEAITRRDSKEEMRIRWVDVTGVSIGETLVPLRNGAVPVRFCMVRGLGTRRVAFADLTYVDNRSLWVGAPGPVPLSDVADSDLLLGIVAERLEDERLLPRPPAEDETEAGSEAAPGEGGAGTDGAEKATGAAAEPRRLRPGLLALALKVGANLFKPVVGLFKGTAGLLALASLGALALLFSWQGALALMVIVFVHEYGHVHAMRRSGLPVKGIYFLPFGAATVSEDTYSTRGQQAYVALSGPLWGGALSVVPLAIVIATGDRYPLVGALAALGAFVNLINLLPIAPLDGGRLLSAVGYSVIGRAALALSLGTLLVGVGLALWAGLYLFVILAAVGLLELAGERAAAVRAGRLDRAPALAASGPAGLARLKVLTRPGFPGASEIRLREAELGRIKRTLKLARISPMTPRQTAFWLGAYLALAAGLTGMLLWLGAVFPGLDALRVVLG